MPYGISIYGDEKPGFHFNGKTFITARWSSHTMAVATWQGTTGNVKHYDIYRNVYSDLPLMTISEVCPYCLEKVYGNANNIDSGLRHHIDYCLSNPNNWV